MRRQLQQHAQLLAISMWAISQMYVPLCSTLYLTQFHQEGDWDDDEDEENTSYVVHLLRSGLPRSVPEEFIDQNMCVPVFPNTKHPSREPLTPTKPLPSNWSNCYHASFETVTLRAPVAYAKRDLAVNLPKDERIKHITAIMADEKRINQLSKEYHPINLVPMVDHSEQPDISPPSGNAVDAPTSSRQSISSRARSVSLASADEDDEASKLIPPPISIMSYDLAAVSAVADPQGLLAEMKFIERYVPLLTNITPRADELDSGCSKKHERESQREKHTQNKKRPAL